jgi:signal transduction histidine kinase
MLKSFGNSIYVKALAFSLFLITFVAFIGGSFAVVYMASDGYYNPGGQNFYNSKFCTDVTTKYSTDVFYNYFSFIKAVEPSPEVAYQLRQYDKQFSQGNTNFFFVISDLDGKACMTNLIDQDYAEPVVNYYSGLVGGYYTLTAFVKDPLTAKDNYSSAYKNFETLYNMRYTIALVAATSAILSIFLFAYLLVSSGHKRNKEGITLSGFNRIPLDLCVAGVLGIMLILLEAYRSQSLDGRDFSSMAWVAGLALISVSSLLAIVLSFAARIKAGKWWENTIIYRILRVAKRSLSVVFTHLPLLLQTILLFGGYLLVNGILVLVLLSSASAVAIFLGFLFNVSILAILCKIMLQMTRLKTAGEKIAAGDFASKMDTTGLLWDLKTHGENLNSIGGGMIKAVEEKMRSERFKTELITNVSHDLKTPITSIVNYIDLLKKEKLPNEKATEYIEILDRQSARLKKLTEDLVEASKASTGNILITPVKTNVVELLNQSIGEYTERFEENKLEAILRSPLKEAFILADGKLMWRVFDNLLNNICKYSQQGTRVYLDIDAKPDQITVSLKNISQYALNITSDELLERFVRGDSSRSTDGSGLGLSIARSLIELQKGTFSLSVDGDLFKVMIGFERVA